MGDRKSRSFPFSGSEGSAKLESYFRGAFVSSSDYTSSSPDTFSHLEGIQVTESESHPEWFARHKPGVFRGDIGGEFFTIKKTITPAFAGVRNLSFVKDDGDGWAYIVKYNGPFLPTNPVNMQFPPDLSSSVDSLNEWGASAVASISPSNPGVDLTTILGELAKDGIPHLTGNLLRGWLKMSGKRRRKAIADEYLNYQFGWKPFVADMRSIANRIVGGNAAIEQYERDSGKMVRRRFGLEPEVDTVAQIIDPEAHPWMSPSIGAMYNYNSPSGVVIAVTKVTRRKWFSGAFTWYIPRRGNSLRDDMARQVIMAKKSLGIRFTPDAVWNLTPWSWAIDWFTNAGDVLQNVSNAIIDGQVLAYGYVMENTIISTTYTFTGPNGLTTAGRPPSFTLTTDVKVRKKASPYGFGITWEGFTPRQQSILAAIGISKGSAR